MIENVWTWAKAENKIITDPISKGEFVELDVEKARKRLEESGVGFRQTASGEVEVGAVLQSTYFKHRHVCEARSTCVNHAWSGQCGHHHGLARHRC